MSYTQTKVTYIGTNEEELELEKRGVKPDYYEYDQAIANGDIKTNYDTLQTTWHKDGIHYTEGVRATPRRKRLPRRRWVLERVGRLWKHPHCRRFQKDTTKL